MRTPETTASEDIEALLESIQQIIGESGYRIRASTLGEGPAWCFLDETRERLRALLSRAPAEPPARKVDVETMERLAANEHDRWAGQAKTALDDMTPERRERWSRLVMTPYAELTEEMKELDRMQVREYLALLTRDPRAESMTENQAYAERDMAESRAEAAEAERDELQSLFDHQQARMGRATEHWIETHDTDKTPDLGDILEWLTARSRRLDVQERLAVIYYDKAEAAEAERDRLKANLVVCEKSLETKRQEAQRLCEENEALSDERDSLKADKRLWQATVVKLGMAEDENARLREENEALRAVAESYEASCAIVSGLLSQNQFDEAWQYAQHATATAKLAACAAKTGGNT